MRRAFEKFLRASGCCGLVFSAFGCMSADPMDDSFVEAESFEADEHLAQTPAVSLEDEPLDPTQPTVESVLSEWTAAAQASMSDDERRSIVTALASRGITEDEISFRGRMVALEGDQLFHAGDLLGGPDGDGLQPKGRVLRETSFAAEDPILCGTPGGIPISPCSLAPVDLANVSGQNMLWRRPDTTKLYYVVAEPGAPSHYTGSNGILKRAVDKINSVVSGSGDCLNHPNALFSVLTFNQYQAVPAPLKNERYEIFVYSDDARNLCQGIGCALMPRNQSSDLGLRLAFGPALVFDPAVGTSNDDVGIVIHELLHAMGFWHSGDHGDERSFTHLIPGTPEGCDDEGPNACQPNGASNGSVMASAASATNDGWHNWVGGAPPGDVNMIKKLYGPGNSCGYTSSFRTVTPCGPNGMLHANGGICCLASCGSCGGPGCGSRPGGSAGCCHGTITGNDEPCGPHDAPCVVR